MGDAPPVEIECTDCGGSGYLSWMAYDGRETVERCRTCEGFGTVLLDDADHLDNVNPIDHSYQLPGVKNGE